MFCTNCGATITELQAFCTSCGISRSGQVGVATQLATSSERSPARFKRSTIVISLAVGFLGIVIGVAFAGAGMAEFAIGARYTQSELERAVAEAEQRDFDGGADTASDITANPVEGVPFEFGTGECPPAEGSVKPRREFSAAPQLCINPAKSYVATFNTTQGQFSVQLFADRAPGTVNNFVSLARWKYFDGTKCHRIIEKFVIQCGDPTATGSGGPGYSFADELPQPGEYKIGSLAMANSGPNTNGSQFFLITGESGVQLPPSYSLFGEVTSGLDTAVRAIAALFNPDPAANGVPPARDVTIESVIITES